MVRSGDHDAAGANRLPATLWLLVVGLVRIPHAPLDVVVDDLGDLEAGWHDHLLARVP